MKRMRILLAILILLTVWSCRVEPPEEKEIEKSKDIIKVTIEGLIYPSEDRKIISPVTARVKKIYKSTGDYVRKGEVILELDIKDLERKYRQALINYKISKIRYEEFYPPQRITASDVAINNAKEDLLKSYELYKKGYISLSELHSAEIRYETLLKSRKESEYTYRKDSYLLQKKRKEALENLKKAKIALEEAKEALKYRYIISPISGFIAKLFPIEGQEIFRNDEIGEIINIDKVKLKGAFFPGTYQFLKVGMEGDVKCFTVPAYLGKAKIEKLVPIVDPTFGRMVLYMTLDNRNYILQPQTKCLISFKFKPEEVGAMGLDLPKEGNEIFIKSNIKSKKLK
jgi:multidrug efflux pump subunit AcrA (membrane-fusion protein)